MGVYTNLFFSNDINFNENFKRHLDIIPNKELRYEVWHLCRFAKPMKIIYTSIRRRIVCGTVYGLCPYDMPASFKASFNAYEILMDIYNGNLNRVNYTALKPYIKDKEAYIKTKELLPSDVFRKLFNNRPDVFATTIAYADRHAYYKFVSDTGDFWRYIDKNELQHIQNAIFELNENTLEGLDCLDVYEVNKVVDEVMKKAFTTLYEEEEKEIEKRKAI